jgi:hypothetical protein
VKRDGGDRAVMRDKDVGHRRQKNPGRL